MGYAGQRETEGRDHAGMEQAGGSRGQSKAGRDWPEAESKPGYGGKRTRQRGEDWPTRPSSDETLQETYLLHVAYGACSSPWRKFVAFNTLKH